jgi:hypothetical protein
MAVKVGQNGNKNTTKFVGEEGEKHSGLTKRTSVCSGKPEEVRTSQISPAT